MIPGEFCQTESGHQVSKYIKALLIMILSSLESSPLALAYSHVPFPYINISLFYQIIFLSNNFYQISMALREISYFNVSLCTICFFFVSMALIISVSYSCFNLFYLSTFSLISNMETNFISNTSQWMLKKNYPLRHLANVLYHIRFFNSPLLTDSMNKM